MILSIETATTNCSVALSKEGKTIAVIEDYDKGYSHAERLHVYINRILSENNIDKSQLDAIAVSKGPGSYTGLRIGVSTAKGLAYALEKPLIAVSTLESLSRQVNIEGGYIVPMLDARRMEVYSAVFNTDFSLARDIKAEVLEENSFQEYLEKEKVYFIGNGVEKTKTIITHPNAVFIDAKLPSANEMGNIAYKKYKANNIEDVAYFEPYYLKDFVAIKSKK
ncbi:tRNA (adenosine(37)-N6)-threonylcarbamoyltransferase complex dimerization subunit type 1 TsaB [Mangrovimonas spongiae]|uniref:tRNA (adenosine(37)-N6)-threonylcarbamoyltransferase complex dimerization subunit type 1 TsaB n=1 Tax=Mangrovimonas spongiae TaxID=2494697 RepID=UPI00269707A5